MQEMVKGNKIRESFGRAVKELRVAKGISQEKLAELGDLDRSYVSEIENGYKTASIITAYKIAIALDISAEKLFQEMENKIS